MRRIKIIDSEYYTAINAEIKLWKITDSTGAILQHYISTTKNDKIKTRFFKNKVEAKNQYDVEKIRLQKLETIERNK